MNSLTSRTLLSAFLLCSAISIGLLTDLPTAMAASKQSISKAVTPQIISAKKMVN